MRICKLLNKKIKLKIKYHEKQTTQIAFEKLDAQNFKVVQPAETKELQGGYCYYYPTAYNAYVRTCVCYCADTELAAFTD